MNPRPSRLRRLAFALMRHATAVLPPERAAWGDAMRNEVEHMDRDSEALRWALGCTLASYVERSRLGGWLQLAWVRAVVAAVLFLRAVDLLFATALTLAYHFRLVGMARFLGGFTPGDDYHRFIPLMDATPWWIHALWLAGSFLTLVAACELLRNRRSAFASFAAAWTLGWCGEFLASTMPAYRAVFAARPVGFVGADLIPTLRLVAPLAIAAMLWTHGRWRARAVEV